MLGETIVGSRATALNLMLSKVVSTSNFADANDWARTGYLTSFAPYRAIRAWLFNPVIWTIVDTGRGGHAAWGP